MHYNRNIPTYERIRKIPAILLIHKRWDELKQIEKEIKKESDRSLLALKWIQGILRIKNKLNLSNISTFFSKED